MSIAIKMERVVYVIGGLPIALRGGRHESNPDAAAIRCAFAHYYWHPKTRRAWMELVGGILTAPVVVPLASVWFAFRNGPAIERRSGKSVAAQILEQLRLYVSSGIAGPWYYILSMHDDRGRRARGFLQRCETKRGIFHLLRPQHSSPLRDKKEFAERCAAAGVRCIPCLASTNDHEIDVAHLPRRDLFVKPRAGRGGRGAERWDRTGDQGWANDGTVLGEKALISHIEAKEKEQIIQPLLAAHPDLRVLTSGALPTVRVLTCLDEHSQPEVVSAVFRMSIGTNRTVDNFHAGGIACAVSLGRGLLGPASDLGMNAALGWRRHHPTTGARITGVQLPYWEELKALAVTAHRAFLDHVVVGWDIAICEDGPVMVEGNHGPDTDIHQRFMRRGFCDGHRVGALLAHQLRVRGY